jgi:hypothetical protein
MANMNLIFKNKTRFHTKVSFFSEISLEPIKVFGKQIEDFIAKFLIKNLMINLDQILEDSFLQFLQYDEIENRNVCRYAVW